MKKKNKKSATPDIASPRSICGGAHGMNMKKGLSYDEEMTLLLELTDSMDEGDREGFTLEEAQRMVEDQHTYERTHGDRKSVV